MLSPLHWRKALVNLVSFGLRGRLRMRRGGYSETPVNLLETVQRHPRAERLRELTERYRPRLDGRFSEHTVLANLDLLDVLDRVVKRPAGPVRALDVGSDTFHLAPALQAFWSTGGELQTL